MLTLPNWATDTIKRHEPGLTGPLALYERIKGGLRLAAIDPEAAAAKLYIGQNLADAQAIVPNLVTREIDQALLTAAFADFADWHSNASPLVAVLTPMRPYGDMALDITGVAHLFGGEEQMLRTLLARLRAQGFTVAGAIASTIGAAWATCHFARSQVVPAADAASLLDTLPVAALRLSEAQIQGLIQLGLKRIGQLRHRDRKVLQARFGASLLERLDQAYGLVEEHLVPRLPAAERFAERRFADPIGLIDDVLMCARDLAIQLALRLEQEGMGAQAFHLFLYRVDHKVMTLSVNAARLTRDPEHIARLFSNRSERLGGEYDPGFGVDTIRLAASSVFALDPLQISALAAEDGAEDLDRLYDRMTSRLGPLAVLRTRLRDTHIPERAARFEPVIAARQDDDAVRPDLRLRRPLRLLPMPEAIRVLAEVPDGPPVSMIWRGVAYQFARASGPERLGAEWWRSGQRLELVPPPRPETLRPGQKPPHVPALALFHADGLTRDYYMAEDGEGRRFWLYRQGVYGTVESPPWYLHGLFS